MSDNANDIPDFAFNPSKEMPSKSVVAKKSKAKELSESESKGQPTYSLVPSSDEEDNVLTSLDCYLRAPERPQLGNPKKATI